MFMTVLLNWCIINVPVFLANNSHLLTAEERMIALKCTLNCTKRPDILHSNQHYPTEFCVTCIAVTLKCDLQSCSMYTWIQQTFCLNCLAMRQLRVHFNDYRIWIIKYLRAKTIRGDGAIMF